MGQPKAWLPFGEELMLPRVVRLLSSIVSPIVVVAAPGQELPDLPADVLRADDEQEGLGPLAGLAAGLETLADSVDAAYATACDVPLLKPEFVRKIIDSLNGHELAIVRDAKYHHPLAAVYRTILLERIHRLLAEDRRRPFFLVQQSDTREIDDELLRDTDPQLDSLKNCNTPDDYASLLKLAGFQQPDE